MEAKHTPGPWRIHWGHDTAYPLGIRTADRNVVNAFGRPAHDESVANAKLIAQAPEMFRILQWIIQKHDEGQLIDGRVILEARAAIAKATS